jgi:hypothetical protein
MKTMKLDDVITSLQQLRGKAGNLDVDLEGIFNVDRGGVTMRVEMFNKEARDEAENKREAERRFLLLALEKLDRYESTVSIGVCETTKRRYEKQFR